MEEKIKVGLWIPPREHLNHTIDEDNPANIDASICKLLYKQLDDSGIIYYDNLDFRKAIIKNHQVYINDFCMSELDHFIWMGDIDRHLNSYHLEVLRVLELSVKVHNSYSFYSIATDKFSAFSILHKYDIPVSDLFLVTQENVTFLEPYFEDNTFLLKPRRSGWGLGIVKVDRFDQLRDILEYHPKKNYYLEKFYPNDMADWTGVSVVNGTVLYGFRKKIEKISGWKVYDREKTGGKIDYVELSPELKSISLRIGEILGANFYGLDFIKTSEGYKVVDINCHPGIYNELIQERNIPIEELFFDMLKLPKKQLV